MYRFMKYSILLVIKVQIKTFPFFIETEWGIAIQTSNKVSILNLVEQSGSTTTTSRKNLMKVFNSV